MEKKTPSRRQAMRPIVNVLKEDPATDTGNMHKNLAKIARAVLEISSRRDRHTDRQTYTHHNTSQPLREVITVLIVDPCLRIACVLQKKKTSRQYLTIVQYHEGEAKPLVLSHNTTYLHANLNIWSSVLHFLKEYLVYISRCETISRKTWYMSY